MAALDLKRELRSLYRAPQGSCEVVEVPELSYLMIDGSGDPNVVPEYRHAVEALYAVAYAVKFAGKRQGADFVVMPLQGLWWADDPSAFLTGERSAWHWTMMILLPDTVSPDLVSECAAAAGERKDLPALEALRFGPYREGMTVQTLHRGPYAAEGPTIAMLHEYLFEQGFDFGGKHHEIYLSDPRRVAAERMKTIIRQPVR